MGKNDKVGLGRALVKHHNQMIQQEKMNTKSQRKKFMESVTDVSDIDAVIQQAEEAERLFDVEQPVSIIPIDLDDRTNGSGVTSEEKREVQKKEEALHASSIRVPRRPSWNAEMSAELLDLNERQSFLIWRRSLAKLEENEKLVLTPFEKNIDIWRQLWRVVERSDLLVTVVDARDPLFYRCPDLEVYVKEVDEHKRTMLLINKADLLPYSIRVKWAQYFHEQGILYLFWSAKAASAALEGKDLALSGDIAKGSKGLDDIDVKIYGRDELLCRLQSEAEDIAMRRKTNSNVQTHPGVVKSSSRSVTVGFVGYPNVGKSSTINALVGEKKTGVTSTPGKTKHFQTLIISEKLTLCDCPGLVFPSFTSSRYEMIACGVLPIDRMTSHRDAVQVVANRVPRNAIERVYKMTLPKPKPYEPQSRPPFAAELLKAYCASRGYVAHGGRPDETKAARIILKDYVDGKLPHYELPPGMDPDEDSEEDEMTDSDSLEEVGSSGAGGYGEEKTVVNKDLLHDLDSFDISNELESKKSKGKEKKPLVASYKHHRKPQRKKDRSWRVGNGNDDGDGMPRVFQKPVNTGPLKV